MQRNPEICPYCQSKNFISEDQFAEIEKTKSLKEIEKLKKAGKFEDAALIYEKMEMWDKVGECRKKSMTGNNASADFNVAKIGSINMLCPRCGTSQPLASKSNQVTCTRCKKEYAIPKKVLDLF